MNESIWQTIIPRPLRHTPGTGSFKVPATVQVYCEQDDVRTTALATFESMARLARTSEEEPGLPAWQITPDRDKADVTLRVAPELPSEAYHMQVATNAITIAGGDHRGVSFALSTLFQGLLHACRNNQVDVDCRLPAVSIEDEPHHRWRGFMFDPSRNFFPVASLYDILDLLWLLRLNRFHLHLTDDQGWRIPIDGYPLLTEIGAWRADGTSEHGSVGGFYTHEELRALDATAASLGITIVPEIDLPGHASAALTAYPELGCTGKAPGVETRWGIFDAVLKPVGETTQHFIDAVFSGVASLFSGEYIHIGGDEVVTTTWKECKDCLDYVQRHGLGGVDDLYEVIVRAMTKSVIANGKRPVAWDEASELDLPKETIILNWRTPEFAKAALDRGYDIVLVPQGAKAYLDHSHLDDPLEPGRLGVCTVRDSASFEPGRYVSEALAGGESTDGHILGGQANLWNEAIASHRHAEYMAIMRLAAISEGLWYGAPGTDTWTEDFRPRLLGLRRMLFELGHNVFPGKLE